MGYDTNNGTSNFAAQFMRTTVAKIKSGGGLGPVSLPYLVDWNDGDISDLTNVTDFGFNNELSAFTSVTSVNNPYPSSGLPAYSKVVYIPSRHPEYESSNAALDLGGYLDLSGGLKIATWRWIATSVWYIYPWYLSNGLPNSSESANTIIGSSNGSQGQPFTRLRVRMQGVDKVTTPQGDATNAVNNGSRWNCFQTAIDFANGTCSTHGWTNNGGSHMQANFNFTPFEPPTDLRYASFGNPGTDSTWSALINTEQQYCAAFWIGSLSDDFPANVSGSAMWSL
jgi:hypothetical protein